MEEENTIELIDLLRVVWRWRWFIIIFTIACIVVTGIISFSMPKIYGVSMVIEPHIVGIDSKGKVIYFGSALNIKSKIDSKVYNSKILEKLNADPKKLKLKFKTILPKKSNVLKIRLESKDVNRGIQILSALFHELVEENQNLIDLKKSTLDQQIDMNKRMLDVRASEKSHLEKEITMVKADMKRLIDGRSLFTNKGENVDRLSLFIYSNIIRQNTAQYNSLKRELNNLILNIEKMKSEIEILENKKRSIQSIKLIQPAQSSIYPIKPKKKLNVILAFVAGLFISIFLVFFLEYIKKMKDYPESSITPGQAPSVKNQEK